MGTITPSASSVVPTRSFAARSIASATFRSPIPRAGEDPRASAVQANVSEPTLLLTFLGRVTSRAGRELERVIAVRVAATGEARYLDTAGEWLDEVRRATPIRTTDVWKNHFERLASDAQERAGSKVIRQFQSEAEAFVDERKQSLAREKTAQREWLTQRANEITGTSIAPAEVQPTLFDGPTDQASAQARPAWQSETDPVQRLAAFQSDRDQTPRARAEADGVLRIYNQRIAHLDALPELNPPEIVPLGLLMMLPKEAPRAS